MEKKRVLMLPVIAMVAYTLGSVFLTFSSSADVMLSPGEGTFGWFNSSFVAGFFLALTVIGFVGAMVIERLRNGKK